MTTSPAGWYPDPAGSGGMRWWDGVTWSDQVQPAAAPAAVAQPWGVGQPAGQPWGAGGAQQQWAGQQTQAPVGFAKRNTNSLVVAAIALVYVVLAATVHIVVLGFLPILFAVRAFRTKEPLAWPAAGIAAAVLIFAFLNFG
ncbi:MAG: hypothetical protein JWP68_2852 [Modestobacter sp.]|jgi:hypothetical protein|nr:hypothetical protein [Modestobacter sp.]